MLALVSVTLNAAHSAVAVIVPIFLLMCLHIVYIRLLMAMRPRESLLSHDHALAGKQDTGQKAIV